jgi:hypothetical protein
MGGKIIGPNRERILGYLHQNTPVIEQRFHEDLERMHESGFIDSIRLRILFGRPVFAWAEMPDEQIMSELHTDIKGANLLDMAILVNWASHDVVSQPLPQ